VSDSIVDIFGAGGVASLINNVVNKIWPDKTEAEKAQIAVQLQESQLGQQLLQGQLEINKIEAANSNVFVSGPRPGMMWCCVLALFNEYFLAPYAQFIADLCHAGVKIPNPDMAPLITIGLGLAGLRSFDIKSGAPGKRL